MKELKGHNFKLRKGDYLVFRKREVSFDNMIKSYIGVVRDYDGVNSKSGCLSSVHIVYHISENIKRASFSLPSVFAWYKTGFLILQDLETGEYSSLLDNFVDVYKMSRKEIAEFKGKILKHEILIRLR